MVFATRRKCYIPSPRIGLRVEAVPSEKPSTSRQPYGRRTQTLADDDLSDASEFYESMPMYMRVSAELNRNPPRDSRVRNFETAYDDLILPYDLYGLISNEAVKELESELRLTRVRRYGTLHAKDECPICHENFKNEVLVRWPCPFGHQHAFHLRCSRESLRHDRRCPVCRHCPFRSVDVRQ
jgi:hypothetical protein